MIRGWCMCVRERAWESVWIDCIPGLPSYLGYTSTPWLAWPRVERKFCASGFTFVFFLRESKLWLVQKTRSTYFEYNKWECVSGRRWYSSVDTKWGGVLCSGKSKSAHIFSGFCMTCLYVNLKNTAGLHKTFKCRQFPLLLTTVDGSSSIHKLWGWTMCSSKTSDLKLSYNVLVSLLEKITIIRRVGCELVV